MVEREPTPFELGVAAKSGELQKKAAAGDPEANFRLYQCLRDGNGVNQNLGRAIKHLRTAAAAGNSEALCDLGYYYWSGRAGFTRNLVLAAKLTRQAAQAGSQMAQINHANNLITGDGVRPDPVEAKSWLEMAATAGHPQAQHNMGVMLSNGEDFDPEPDMAASWFIKASQQGHPSSPDQLQFVLGKLGDQIKEETAEAIRTELRRRLGGAPGDVMAFRL